jgi:membrane protease YdiL (CAAX protease family)
MLLSTILWIKIVEKKSIRNEIDLNEKGLTILIYMFSAVIVFFFTRRSFREATLLTGDYLIVPFFEELFFRKYLLGSMVEGLPKLHGLHQIEQIRLIKRSFFPLIITSIMFALVHDDVIAAFLSLPLFSFNSLLIIVLRVIFSLSVGGLYLIEKKWLMPTIFHVTFNLSYFLLN